VAESVEVAKIYVPLERKGKAKTLTSDFFAFAEVVFAAAAAIDAKDRNRP
jgi:hypothetical protein